MSSDNRWNDLVSLLRSYCRGSFGDDPKKIIIHLTRGEKATLPIPAPGLSDAETEGRTALEKLIIDVMSDAEKPLKGAAIANRAGKDYSSYFRTTLSGLVRRQVLTKTNDGYWLSDRELSEERT